MIDQNQQAKTGWIDDNIPFSKQFGDTYYTKSDGRAETDHVFILGNSLPDRWAGLKHCTIAELGFGTGLNFLETVRQWNSMKMPGASLHFISFERYPLAVGDIRRALSRWPELDELAGRLCEKWLSNDGALEIQFSSDILLQVNVGDANILLPKSEFCADAWYLDGFSPAKNPELWNENLLKEVYLSTKPGGTFATYSVAGLVRRNLQSAGFDIFRKKGFGSKREMLAGYRQIDSGVSNWENI